ncbi:hypothetical protein DFJ73DRAFT_529027 [Zopfochytrium polystomum]|nr:hypothetical protein DFJ73DRAFT_529027 [Zopfochytrium polystomum]
MTVPRLRQSVSDLKQSAMFNSLPRTATANGNSFDVYPQSNARSHPLVPTISQSSSLEISSPDQNGFSYPPSPTFANSSRPATSDSPSPPLVFSTSHAKHNNDSSASAASGPTAMDFSAPTQSNFGRRDASQGSLKPSGPTDSDRLERSYSSASVASIASLASTISQGSTVATHSSNLNNPTPQPTPPQPTPGTVPASTQNLQNATFHQQFLDLQERSLKDLGSRPVVGLPLGAAGMGPVNRLKTESPNHIWLKPNQGSKPSGSLSASLLLGQGAVFFDSPAASGATWPQVSSPAAFSHAVNVVRPESPPSGNGSQTKRMSS